jgi:hypothetical protein
MVDYSFLCIILLLILCVELIKLCGDTWEGFSSSPTENRLSNYDENNTSDRFAADGEEILIMTQELNGERKMEFSNIRTTLDKWIIIIVKSNRTGVYTQISNFPPIQVKYLNYKTMNMLGQNNFLISDNSKLLYYIKFLNRDLRNNEVEKVNKINTKKENHELCQKVHSGAPRNQAIERCSVHT